MTRDVQHVIASAALHGVEVDEFEAESYLKAKRILQRNPRDALAREVIELFARHLSTNIRTPSFAEFMLREPEPTP